MCVCVHRAGQTPGIIPFKPHGLKVKMKGCIRQLILESVLSFQILSSTGRILNDSENGA